MLTSALNQMKIAAGFKAIIEEILLRYGQRNKGVY
jgi:hypothetical protein